MVLVQPKPIMLAERKPVAPSLLSDPAFSTSPYAHPYAVTSHEPWLSSPPAGHPTLKSKSRRRRPADDTASDSEPFHTIPPPNSPVNFPEGSQSSTTFAVPNDPDTGARLEPHSQSPSSPTTAAEPASESESGQSHQEPYLSPTLPPPTAHPPTPKRRITLMTLLKRRSSHQPQSSVSADPKLRKASTLSKSVANRSDVTLPPISFPETNPDIKRQVLPPRPATLGTSTPATTPMPSTGHPTPKRRPTEIPTNRQENLDRIDELDETNPWGVALHHGGPYEAAVQAIRGKETIVFPGYGSYNRGIPQPHDNNYFPPQATGLSLNLSPGQVLPRNYHSHHRPGSHPVQNSNPAPPMAVMMRPPAKKSHPQPQTSKLVPPMQSSATLPVSSRRQSYQTFPVTPREFQFRRQSLNPTPTTSQIILHTPSPLSSSSYTPPQQQEPHRVPPFVTNPQVSNSRPVETQGQVTGNPLSSINLVSIGIGMAMLDNDDDDESEESSSSAPSQPSSTPDGGRPKGLPLSNTAFVTKTSPERTQSGNVTSPQEGIHPVSLGTQPRKTTLEKMHDLARGSPPPYSSPNKEHQPTEFGYFQSVIPASTSSTQELGSSFARSEVAFSHSNSQVPFVPMQALSRAPTAQNQPAFRTDAPRSYPSSRNSPERAGFEDSHSVHPSVSSKSSSSRSSGPPSSRRVPKRLVMPAPLAQPSVISPQYQNRPPLAQLPPQHPTRQSLHSAPLGPLSTEPMPSTQIFVKARAQEICLAPSKVGKLKKSLSLIGPPSHHPPVVTTVSFAPPIIGFNSVAQEGDLRHKLTHKRVLSKRKSNW